MRSFFFGFATVLALSVGIGTVASAAPQCGQRDSVQQFLQKEYKEQSVAVGVSHNGGLVEVLTSEDGATWSIIVTTPQGVSCLVAAGENWRAMEHVALDPEA